MTSESDLLRHHNLFHDNISGGCSCAVSEVSSYLTTWEQTLGITASCLCDEHVIGQGATNVMTGDRWWSLNCPFLLYYSLGHIVTTARVVRNFCMSYFLFSDLPSCLVSWMRCQETWPNGVTALFTTWLQAPSLQYDRSAGLDEWNKPNHNQKLQVTRRAC